MGNTLELNGMTQSQNISVLTDWWDKHHDLGGHVYYDYDRYTLDQCPKPYLEELAYKYSLVTDAEKEQFITSDVMDNSMPNREVMEDAAKIAMLVNAYREEQMNFHVQIIYEPWKDRWRVHPGSGRYVAQWLCGVIMCKIIYIHFNEPGFKLLTRGIKIRSPEDFVEHIQYQNKQAPIDFQTYRAFPTNKKDREWTQDRDSEWNPTIKTKKPWEFIRYSEGDHFLDYKADWRNYVFDFDLDRLRNS